MAHHLSDTKLGNPRLHAGAVGDPRKRVKAGLPSDRRLPGAFPYDIDPQAWLADVLARFAGLPQSRLAEFLPWNWKAQSARLAA